MDEPGGAEYSVAFQLTGEITAESENGTGILPFQGVPHSIFTERANTFRKSTAVAFRFDAVQSGKLTRGTQKHRVKDLLPVVAWRLATIGQSAHFCGEIKHFVQIGFESGSLLSPNVFDRIEHTAESLAAGID